MAVKKDTVKNTPLGTLNEKGPKDKAPPEQKGYHGSEDAQSQTSAEAENEAAQKLERERLGKQDADETGSGLDKDIE